MWSSMEISVDKKVKAVEEHQTLHGTQEGAGLKKRADAFPGSFTACMGWHSAILM